MARAVKKITDVIVDFEGETGAEDTAEVLSPTEDQPEVVTQKAEPMDSGLVSVMALVNKSVYSGGKMVHLIKGKYLELPATVAADWKKHKYVE